MWKKIRSMLPHLPIVLANMYVVFFLIDRVNTSMNFIDNGLTKAVLLAMAVLSILDWLLAPRTRRGRSTGARKLAALGAASASAILVLLLIDWLKPDWSLLLNEGVKWGILACCAIVILGSGALLHRSRRLLRRRLKRAGHRART